MKGYVQVYTGDGKGKTTAALGLILRARGAGLRVYLGQFIKKGDFSEIKSLRERFPEVTVEQYGLGHFIKEEPSPDDIAAAMEGLGKLRTAVLSGDYDIIIADEAGPAVTVGLFPADELVSLIDQKPDEVELVITGRGVDKTVMARADLITEMRSVKHYMDDGVGARQGIES